MLTFISSDKIHVKNKLTHMLVLTYELFIDVIN